MILLHLLLSLPFFFNNSTSEFKKGGKLLNMACDITKHTETAVKTLPAGYTFLKTLKIDGEGGKKTKIEHSYIFSNGLTYSINYSNESGSGVSIFLYDSNRSPKGSGNQIIYSCGRTGVYYMVYEFTGSDYCAASVVSVKR